MDRAELDVFYRATTFLVYRPGGPDIPIRVGAHHPALDDAIRQAGESWAFLTACNPRSVVFTPAENAARMNALVRDVTDLGFEVWHGLGISDATDWKPEESVLVIGMSRELADLISERYDQNAFVYGELGGVAELIWTGECQGAAEPGVHQRAR